MCVTAASQPASQQASKASKAKQSKQAKHFGFKRFINIT
jgi:hypothetical protein